MNRKYQMTRIKAGDYLLPSNDARWLLRIASYEEDGNATWGNTDKQVLGTFWAVYRRPMPQDGDLMEDVLEWSDDWEFWAGTLSTRKAAIDEALAIEEVAAMRER